MHVTIIRHPLPAHGYRITNADRRTTLDTLSCIPLALTTLGERVNEKTKSKDISKTTKCEIQGMLLVVKSFARIEVNDSVNKDIFSCNSDVFNLLSWGERK